MKNYIYFWGLESEYSQWHPAKFKVKDYEFHSAEQFMMFCKAKLFKDEESAQHILTIANSVVEEFMTGKLSADEILKNKQLRTEWSNVQKRIKYIGKKVRGFNESLWDKKKCSYVKVGNKHKFSQNKALLASILKEVDPVFVEASPYDKIWGIGMTEREAIHKTEKEWRGQNLLGKILNEVHSELLIECNKENSSTMDM